MSRISKRKLIKALKGNLEMPVNRKTLLDQLAKPVTQEQWLRGYKEWIEQHTASTPRKVYEAIENMSKKKKRKKNTSD